MTTLSSQSHSLCFTRTAITPATYFPPPNLISFRLHRFRSSFTTRNSDPIHLKAIEFKDDVQKRVVRSNSLNFDSLLSSMELSCLVSSAIFSVFLAVNGSKNWLTMVSGNKVSVVWGVLMVVSGVGFGAWIRRRQWRSVKGGLVERIEKLEEELRNMLRVIRVLSRHAEKLGKRFQDTRHNLKDPITQSAAIAQKNSEATRALALQSQILDNEFREIQKVLLAMQEQQQKQLDLILLLGKSGKQWESESDTPKE